MENVENSFKIDVVRTVNLPFIQEEMTLKKINSMSIRTDNVKLNTACQRKIKSVIFTGRPLKS